MENKLIKRYLISSGITFASVFFISFGMLVQSTATADNLTTSLLVSIVGTAARAAVKAVVEGFVEWYQGRLLAGKKKK